MSAKNLRGRVELVVGRLGAGKTTWAALRARELARISKRPLATSGIGWGDEWQEIASMDDLEDLRDSVLLWDEIHLWAPSSRGVVNKDHEMQLLKVLSLARKRGLCVVGTTQAYTRVATHVRQLVTSVHWCKPIIPGTLHSAKWTTPVEDGQEPIGFAKRFRPSSARIPTRAEVWLPPSLWGDAKPVPSSSPEPSPVGSWSSVIGRAG